MLCLSENDLKNFIGGVIRNVAKELKLNQWEQQTYYKLVQQIKTENQAVSEKLEEFFNAYKKWHDLQVKLSQQNQAGDISAADKDRLHSYISARDIAREALLRELRK
ncbi:MAG: hypothetical protein QX199_13995 [Methylococcaceae bacterium]